MRSVACLVKFSPDYWDLDPRLREAPPAAGRKLHRWDQLPDYINKCQQVTCSEAEQRDETRRTIGPIWIWLRVKIRLKYWCWWDPGAPSEDHTCRTRPQTMTQAKSPRVCVHLGIMSTVRLSRVSLRTGSKNSDHECLGLLFFSPWVCLICQHKRISCCPQCFKGWIRRWRSQNTPCWLAADDTSSTRWQQLRKWTNLVVIWVSRGPVMSFEYFVLLWF